MSNFGAEAERSSIFFRCEAENVFKMLLTLHGIVPWVPEVLFFFREKQAIKTETRKLRTSGHGGLEPHFHGNSE